MGRKMKPNKKGILIAVLSILSLWIIYHSFSWVYFSWKFNNQNASFYEYTYNKIINKKTYSLNEMDTMLKNVYFYEDKILIQWDNFNSLVKQEYLNTKDYTKIIQFKKNADLRDMVKTLYGYDLIYLSKFKPLNISKDCYILKLSYSEILSVSNEKFDFYKYGHKNYINTERCSDRKNCYLYITEKWLLESDKRYECK